jgi:hemerythrin-like domain-containing protein
MNAIQLLTQDHKKVRQLLSELEGTTTRNVRDRERLVKEIEQEVTINAQIEEEIFYPAFKAAAEEEEDNEMFFEAAEEHHVVEMVLPELVQTDPSTDEFSAKAKVLKELIEHHADEEEKEMFKRAKSIMEKNELEELGTRMEERKMELGGEELEMVGAGASSGRAMARSGGGARAQSGTRSSSSTSGSKRSTASRSSNGSSNGARSRSGSTKSASSSRSRSGSTTSRKRK